MTGEPTLHYGDQSADGWVEYAQGLLLGVAPNLAGDGIFGDQTINAVYTFQQQNGLMVDGVIGDETWSVLRGGERAAVGTDGHQHQDTDATMHAVFYQEQNQYGQNGEYSDTGDNLVFFLESVGAANVPDNEYYLDINISGNTGITHKESPLAGVLAQGQSKAGEMMMTSIEGLKAELGAGEYSYVAEIPSGLGGERHEGRFTIA